MSIIQVITGKCATDYICLSVQC